MLNKTVLAASVLLLIASATAQTGSTAQQRQMTPEMKAQIAKMQPIRDLAQDIRLLPDLEKNKATAMTKAQAKQLLSILTTLQKATTVQPNDAKKYLAQIEDKIMTEKQLTAMDGLQIIADKEAAARRAQRQASGQTGLNRIPGVPGGFTGQAGQRTNRTGQTGQFDPSKFDPSKFDPSKFNPFKQGRSADALKAYIAVLQKK